MGVKRATQKKKVVKRKPKKQPTKPQNINITIDQSKRSVNRSIRHGGESQKSHAPSVITSFIPAPAPAPMPFFNNQPRNQFQEAIRSSQQQAQPVAQPAQQQILQPAPQPAPQPAGQGILSGIYQAMERAVEPEEENDLEKAKPKVTKPVAIPIINKEEPEQEAPKRKTIPTKPREEQKINVNGKEVILEPKPMNFLSELKGAVGGKNLKKTKPDETEEPLPLPKPQPLSFLSELKGAVGGKKLKKVKQEDEEMPPLVEDVPTQFAKPEPTLANKLEASAKRESNTPIEDAQKFELSQLTTNQLKQAMKGKYSGKLGRNDLLALAETHPEKDLFIEKGIKIKGLPEALAEPDENVIEPAGGYIDMGGVD